MIYEKERVDKIIELLINEDNMKLLLLNNLSKIYGIVKKSGNLKEFYTANINNKLRLFIKPIIEYPYILEEVIEVELCKIDDTHYEGG